MFASSPREGTRVVQARTQLGLVLGVAALLACAVTPEPLPPEERMARAEADLALLFAPEEPLDGPVDLYAAMGRAVRFNLDHRLARMEQALADRRLADARLDLLPRLVATDGYYGRSNDLGSVSESLLTGNQSLEASTSQERTVHRRDLTLAWNVLDFGLSWVRASQEANQSLIARERRMKAVQQVVAEVRRSFWRVAAAQRALPEVERVTEAVRFALARSRELEAERLQDPSEALAYRRALLTRLEELGALRRELELAEVELAALLNARPGSHLELVTPDPEDWVVPALLLPLETMESDALLARSELREQDYQLRISRLEVRRAMLRVLPGLELSVGRHQDSNRYLTNEDWWSWSAVLSHNLIQLVTAPSDIRVARAGVDVANVRRLALSMAVIAQVHVAHRQYERALDALRVAEEARRVEARQLDVSRARLDAGRSSRLDLVRSETDELLAGLRHQLAYADLQGAYGRLLSSLGVRPYREEEELADAGALAASIRAAEQSWRRRAEILRDHPGAVVVSDYPAGDVRAN